MYVPSLAYSKDQPNTPEYNQGIIMQYYEAQCAIHCIAIHCVQMDVTHAIL